MTELRRIKDHVDLRLSDVFLREESPSPFTVSESVHTEIVRSDIEIGAIDEFIADLMERFKSGDAGEIDQAFTVPFHQLLPVSRREAADKRMWAWLGMVKYPQFVAMRFAPTPSGLRSAERFNGGSVRQVFSRLWWAAELTRDDDGSYEFTEDFLSLPGFQDINEAVQGRDFCQYRPALKAFIDVLGKEKEKVIRQVAKDWSYLLTTLVLEGMDEAQLKESLQEIMANGDI
jgi:hypothetical protein